MPLPGSERPPADTGRILGTPSPRMHIAVSIYARRNPRHERQAASLPDRLGAHPPQTRRYLTRAKFDAIYGAHADDLANIAAWVERCRLRVRSRSIAHRRVIAVGRVADVERAFGVKLHYYKDSGGHRYLGRVGLVHVPASLVDVVRGVFGLDRRHLGTSRRRASPTPPLSIEAADELRDRWPRMFFPPHVARLYDYPPRLYGRGQTIAILAFNAGRGDARRGGYRRAALRTYFERVLRGRMPEVVDVVVRGPGNTPGPDTAESANHGDVTSEVMLDLCVVGSVAPKATIVVYFSEFTTQGWVDALSDIVAGDHDVDVVSISYGNPEHDTRGAWTPMGVRLVNEILQGAAARGITICCASGDDGSRDQESGGAHVDFPASSPYALAVGGTHLQVADGTPLQLVETAWNDLRRRKGATGGGVSCVFPKPSYQRGIRLAHPRGLPRLIGRGVPDVAAVADPLTGVIVIHVDGRRLMPIGGTSVAAPLWAALVARLNEALGVRCGFLNPILYRRCARGVLRDITAGTNGAFRAGRGWDACTGLGAPGGQALLHALTTRRTTKRATRKGAGVS